MPLPVLIAARNEQDYIGSTLASLPTDVEPIVLPNGCTDQTVAIAERFGATIINCPPEGKLPALQRGIQYLGNRAAEPFVTLDADTTPIFPSHWARVLLRERHRMDQQRAGLIVGPLLFSRQIDVVTGVLKTVKHSFTQHKTRDQDQGGYFNGANMLIELKEQQSIKQVLSLPNIWPGEDMAIRDIVLGHGGITRKTINPLAYAITGSDRYPSMVTRLHIGKAAYTAKIHDSYLADAGTDTISYTQWRRSETTGRIV